MDEPCSALDPISTDRIEELIKELSKTMKTHQKKKLRNGVLTNLIFFISLKILVVDTPYGLR